MSQVVEFVIGTEVRCEGKACGAIRHIIVDPPTKTVTHLIVSAYEGRDETRLVPIDLVSGEANNLVLDCTLAGFESLPEGQVIDAIPVGAYGFGLGLGGAADMGRGVGEYSTVARSDNVPVDEAEIENGEHVHAVDGRIGRIHGVTVDLTDNHVTHVLLGEGHLWGAKEIAIPISAVTEMSKSIVLNLTKAQVEALPPLA